MYRYKIIIEYNGKKFHGWQKQRGITTIQGIIEKLRGVLHLLLLVTDKTLESKDAITY